MGLEHGKNPLNMERLELCVLRSTSFPEDGENVPERDFFVCALNLLENKRSGRENSVDKAPWDRYDSCKAVGTDCGGSPEKEELCKLERFWLDELEGLVPLTEDGSAEDLTAAWETTLQLLFEAESCLAEGVPVSEKEWKDILYSYSYDYAGEFLSRDEARRKEGKKTALRFVTELIRIVLKEGNEEVTSHVGDGIRLFFGDRLKARLLCVMEKSGMRKKEELPDNNERIFPEIPGTGAHQKKSLAEFIKKAALFGVLVMLGLLLAACGGQEEEETVPAVTEAAYSYPGTVNYTSDDGSISERFGVMHATILDVQKGEKDGLYVYTLRDEEDPDNVWCLYSQDIGSIVAEMNGGKKVAVLFSGDIVNDPDNLAFIAVLDEAPYTIKKAEGSTVSNMMNSFIIRTDKNGEMTFIKDNCKVDRDALSTENGTRVLVYYADCGGNNKYPVRVYKVTGRTR